MAEMHSRQYRVWDVGQEKFFDGWVFLGTDGFLYDCGIDDGPSLLRPDWFVQERVIQGGKFYRWSGMKVDTYIIDHQHEWYILEFATGYLDIAKKMIYQGDLVKNTWGDVREVTWYEFEDCCVNGHTWMLGRPDPAKSTLYDELDEKLVVIGNIHENPELVNGN